MDTALVFETMWAFLKFLLVMAVGILAGVITGFWFAGKMMGSF